MKALFIGGTGTISTDVVALAQQRGWEITLLNRGSKKVPEGTLSIIADINDEEAVAKAIANENYDVVAQFIGYTAEDVQRDIRLFRNKTKQYIFISSASAYQKPLADYRITESTSLSNPYWQYSRNKIEAEEVLMSAYRSDGFPVTIVRPSHTYNGTKPPVCVHGSKGNWQILKRILDGKPVIIPGDGTSLWTLTHSKDFAKGYVGLMANPHAIGNAFHITTDESMTWNQIYQTIADALGKPLNALHVPSDFLARHGENYDFKGELLGDKASTVVFDNSKIKRLVPDFICNISMADGLQQAVQFMLAHPETQTPDLEFEMWCDRIAVAMCAADEAFLKNPR
ncbi:SDR family oxidoreductase [uncultured Bacteroides sp.]|uniref:SDR family oxidoreductase n=1 Tax=uncultured Bacteroides sp. TaxID=162156 RepID=UPI0025E1757C|nr:SDR family oxidoreductase [uncultured Bacteroides sp.]